MKKKHPVLVEVSADFLGNVYIGDRLIKGCLSTTGYWQYGIKGKTLAGHRVVVECMLGRELDSTEVVNHKNFIRTDNRVVNLEVGTQLSNIHHYHREKAAHINEDAKVVREWKAGENHHNARLSQVQVENMILQFFEGMTNDQAAEKYGVHSRYVSLIRHKKRWKKAWVALGLEGSETIPSGSRAGSKGLLETETPLQVIDYV